MEHACQSACLTERKRTIMFNRIRKFKANEWRVIPLYPFCENGGIKLCPYVLPNFKNRHSPENIAIVTHSLRFPPPAWFLTEIVHLFSEKVLANITLAPSISKKPATTCKYEFVLRKIRTLSRDPGSQIVNLSDLLHT